MKNVIVIHHYGGLGGAGKSLLINLSRLVDYANVSVALPKTPPDMRNEFQKIERLNVIGLDSVPILPIYSGGLSVFSPRFYIHLFKSLIMLPSFLKKVKSFDSDLLIVNSMTLCWLSLIYKNKRKVCFVRETKAGSIADCLIKKLLNRFDEVVFISKFDQIEWQLNTKTSVIENSFIPDDSESDDLVSPEKSNLKYKNILFFGGTSYIKGFYHLMLALTKINNKNYANIYVLGELNSKVRKLFSIFMVKLGVNIYWVGKVSNVGYYLKKCDLVVFPVVKIHQGRPIFEAGAFSKPVIVPNFENLKEFVTSDFNGIIYEKRNSNDLARVIDEVIENKHNLARYGVNNNLKYHKKHSLNTTNRKFINFIRRYL